MYFFFLLWRFQEVEAELHVHTLSYTHTHTQSAFLQAKCLRFWVDEQLEAEDQLHLIGLWDFPSLNLEIN